jgi:hypothetical protein
MAGRWLDQLVLEEYAERTGSLDFSQVGYLLENRISRLSGTRGTCVEYTLIEDMEFYVERDAVKLGELRHRVCVFFYEVVTLYEKIVSPFACLYITIAHY